MTTTVESLKIRINISFEMSRNVLKRVDINVYRFSVLHSKKVLRSQKVQLRPPLLSNKTPWCPLYSRFEGAQRNLT